MISELSHKRCGTHERVPNPTCASPRSYRSRRQNPDRAGARPGGCLPGQPSNGLWRRGQAAIPQGVARRPARCASLRPLGEAWVSPLRDSRWRGCGYRQRTGWVLGVVTWGKWHANRTGEVPRRPCLGRVRPAYKPVAKWQAYAAERLRLPQPRPP